MNRLNLNPEPPPEDDSPSLEELVKFRDRYGLEAYVIWMIAFVALPAWMLLNLMKIARVFGGLRDDQYERKALMELVRRPDCTLTIAEIESRAENGDFVSLAMVQDVKGPE